VGMTPAEKQVPHRAFGTVRNDIFRTLLSVASLRGRTKASVPTRSVHTRLRGGFYFFGLLRVAEGERDSADLFAERDFLAEVGLRP